MLRFTFWSMFKVQTQLAHNHTASPYKSQDTARLNLEVLPDFIITEKVNIGGRVRSTYHRNKDRLCQT